jgi:predicted ATPase/DNA-binding winged helix-turn-helix (wHTH) protein
VFAVHRSNIELMSLMSARAHGPSRETGEEPNNENAVSFGPFRLKIAERRLERNGTIVPLGARAFDILVTLIGRAGTVVSKSDIMAGAWPHATVDDSALRVQIVALRKALGEGEGGARYLTTVSGQGYCFVARLQHRDDAKPAAARQIASPVPNLPARPQQLVGRDLAIDTIAERLNKGRFVTIVGPGGIGKTTVAIAAGHALLAQFNGAVHFFDLGTIRDADQVPSLVASTLGLAGQAGNPSERLVNFVRDKRLLLVLDCCEHVIERAAALAERLYIEAPQIHVLATSREALRVEGEHVYRLPPLASPPGDTAITAAEALGFPAIQLFVERANASSGQFRLSDAEAPLVGELCRRLDGIALAIELAAGRVGTYGVRQTIELLNNQFKLLWEGRRTAPARHQTLRATLDWSYNLLSEPERRTLHRLSVLVGNFTLDAARSVAAANEADEAQTIASVANLVAKSILTASASGPIAHYRLLDTMRTYAQEKLHADMDADATAARHAGYCLRLLDGGDDRSREDLASVANQLGNISAALRWCFSPHGDRATGVALAAAAMPLFIEMSLLAECQAWARLAIDALDGIDHDTSHELELHAALGLARMWTGDTPENAESCFAYALQLAERNDDVANQLRLIDRLHLLHFMAGNLNGALEMAQRGIAIAIANANARADEDFDTLARMRVSLGISHLLTGDIAAARADVEAAQFQQRGTERRGRGRYSIDYPGRGQITLARILWLQGYPDQAVTMADQAIASAIAIGHPVRLTRTLLWAFAISAWNGEAQDYEEHAERIIQESSKHDLGPFQTIGAAIKGVVRAAQGKPAEAVALLRESMGKMGRHRYGPVTEFGIHLARALGQIGQRAEALEVIDGAIARAKSSNYLLELADMLRVKAELLDSADDAQAERLLGDSLDLARRQSAAGFELRTAISLARLLQRQTRFVAARDLLAPVYAQFTEGFGRPNMIAARALLDGLKRHGPDAHG